MKKLSYVLLAVLSVAGLGLAQNQQNETSPPPQRPPHPRMGMSGFPGMSGIPGLGKDWWRNSEIAQQINLSDTQKQSLSEIFSAHRGTLIQLRGNVETEEGKLRALLDQDQPQQEQVMTEVAQLQRQRNALENEFVVMSLAFRGVLNSDQWKQLRSLAGQRMMNFKMRHAERGAGTNSPPQPQ